MLINIECKEMAPLFYKQNNMKEHAGIKPAFIPITIPTGHKIEFEIGQIVYLKTDREQQERIVTGITLRPNNGITYWLCLGIDESCHFGIEISNERDIIKATTC